MVHFVGAGPGAPDLITLRGAALLREADVVIYAGSLVNPALLEGCRPGCEIYDSARMTLDEVLQVMERAEAEGKTTVRLHTGDPSLYGAVREQFDALRERGIAFDVTPGVSSLFGASAALGAEFTLPARHWMRWHGTARPWRSSFQGGCWSACRSASSRAAMPRIRPRRWCIRRPGRTNDVSAVRSGRSPGRAGML